uniref:Aldehyde dehydrogenase domain-containing protein n=1 Tax=Gouania willdenowi TaxID=441366 RepID=A0A8C5HL57_GOUWI
GSSFCFLIFFCLLLQAWLEQRSRSLGFFIDGKFVCPVERQRCDLTDSKGAAVCSTACAEDEDVSQCCSSALDGLTAMCSLTCDQRAKVLLRLASVLGQHGQCVSELCGLCGVSTSPSVLVRMLQFYSSWAQLRDTLIPGWAPIGVVAVISSDDCSLCSLMLKVFPALAMGNPVVVIPGQSCAPPTLLLAQLFTASGLPAGALNVLTGNAVTLGAKVAQNPSIQYVAYTGNKQDGVMLCKATAGMGVPVSVTPCVGATCPFIIFDSADIDSAVDEVMEAAFRKKREVMTWVNCNCESVVDSVVARLKMRVAGKECVALRSEAERGLVDAAVQEAQQQGATLIQSCTPPSSGALYPPTVLCGAAAASSCVVSPSAGPLLPLITFRGNTEAVTLGNHSPHGQAASIWTEELTLALETANSLSVGSVWVNSHSVFDPCLPASGHKDSGTCTDGGQEGLYQFLRPSSCSSVIVHSTPASLDYAKFGESVASPIIPNESGSAPQFYLQFVGGKPCKAVSGRSVPVLTPGGESVLAYVPDGGRKDVRNAVEAAIKVQPGWMKKSPTARAQSLYALAKALEAKRRDIVVSLSSHAGLSVDEAENEVELSVNRLTVWAAYCDKVRGGSLPMPRSGSALSFPEALGVVGVVLPEKNPILSMVTLLGAAVATGNAVILVPNQENPLPVLAFIQVLQASDLPAGLVNVITGSRDQLTAALANHNVIKAIWYWGGAEGCQYLQYTCNSPLKTLRLCSDKNKPSQYWTRSLPVLLEDLWRSGVQWKSVWIPTA